MKNGNEPPRDGEDDDKVITIRQFNDVDIGQRRSGYLNATAMCKANGKLWGHYWATDMAQEFARALSGSIGIPIDLLVVSVTTGPNDQRGTWVHPQVGYHLAQWCSPAFAVKVTEWILDLSTKGYAALPGVQLNPKPISSLEELTKAMNALARLLGEMRRTLGCRAAAKAAGALIRRIGVFLDPSDVPEEWRLPGLFDGEPEGGK